MAGSAIAAAGSVAGAYISSQGAKSGASGANKITAQATQEAKNNVLAGRDQALATLSPYTTAGADSTSRLETLLGIGGDSSSTDYGSLNKTFTSADLPTNDGYQFQLKQGLAALQRTQAANGGLLSGAAAKAIDDYSQGLASTEYQNAFNNYNTNQTNLYNRLSGLSTTGESAAGQAANTQVNAANNIAGLITGQGVTTANNNTAANTVSTNAFSTGLSQLGNTLSSALTNNSRSNSGTTSLGTGLYSTLNNPGTAGIVWN